MDHSNLITKIALDKNKEKLGKIIRIDQLLAKTVKKHVPYAIILVRKIFKRDILVPLEVSTMERIDGQFALFTIEKAEFDKMEQVQRVLQDERRNSGEYVPFREKWYGPGHFMLAPRDRDKRRRK